MRTLNSYRVVAIGILLISAVLAPAAQAAGGRGKGDQSRDQTRVWVSDYLRYLKLDDKASAAELDQLTDLRIKMVSQATSLDDRRATVKDFAAIMLKLWGNSPFQSDQQLTQFANNFGRLINWLVLDKTAKAASASTTPLGQLGRVEKRGHGPIPMILIADLRMDWDVYQSFMDRNGERYTMYAVTLPGFAGTPPPPRIPFDGKSTPWWDGVERGIVDLIGREKLARPVVVGSVASAYLAARLALDHPDKIRAAVLLDGNVYQPVPPPSDPNKPMSLQERPLALAKMPNAYGMFSELLPPVLPSVEDMEERLKSVPMSQVSTFFVMRDVERARALAIRAQMGSDPKGLSLRQ